MKPRAWILVGVLVVAAAITVLLVRPDRDSETRSVSDPKQGPAPTAAAPVPTLTPGETAPEAPALPGSAAPNEALESLAGYPVNLEELRERLPDNRYWELGIPTSDPAVARARAERAKRNNDLFGRTQTGEATEPEIRAYYAEQRRVSEDYLKLSELVLVEKGAELTERDRGMFELSVSMHRARLKQIERDLSDALARRREKAR